MTATVSRPRTTTVPTRHSNANKAATGTNAVAPDP